MLRSAKYKARVVRYQQYSVHHREIGVGNLVLRKSEAATSSAELKKFSPNGHGLLITKEVISNGPYKLATRMAQWHVNLHTWNVGNFVRLYY